jgi:predicted nucleic acid-binding protein
MIVLVSDTSILIDLERGGLLEAAFSCGLTMVVPDLLYERELESENGPYLRQLGLGVVELTPEELELAQRLRAERKKLSLPDCFALSCATRVGHILITSDGDLRKEAISRIGVVYGLLWLLDQLAASGQVPIAQLWDGLNRISSHSRCRLPHAEVRSRLDAWSQGPPATVPQTTKP